MSYCRWSECDVYAYDSCEGGVQFYVAGSDSLNRLCGTYSEAYQYAKELRDKHGLDVPSYAIDALREDAIDEAKRHFGPDSAVAELISENAKMRELVEDMLSCIEIQIAFDRTPEKWMYKEFSGRAQELGIEADE